MHKLFVRGVAAAFLASAAIFTPLSAQAADGNIVELAQGTESLSTLTAAVVAGGLAETLSGEGPFTVFAPTHDACAALPDGTVDTLLQPENQGQLQAVLTYHVVAGEVTAAALVEQIEAAGGTLEIETVQGATLSAMIEGDAVMLRDQAGNTVTVTATDIDATNGVVHVIDGVLLPTAG